MAKRPTPDTWLSARQQWEADPKETFESIAKVVGVSRVAVSKRAEKEGWERPTNLSQIAEQAQLRADSKVTPKLSKPAEVSPVTGKTTEDAAIQIRSAVIEQHRRDWLEHRDLFTLEKIGSDFEVGKQAKISAEMLTLRQRGERDAYGLETKGGSGDAPTVTMRDLTGKKA